MEKSLEFNDWSTHLMQAQIQLKSMEHKLLHRDMDGIGAHAAAAKSAIDKTMAWAAMQGSNANVDVVPIIQRLLDAMGESDMSRPYLIAAIQEICQLRGERQFWLKSGYDIGAKGE